MTTEADVRGLLGEHAIWRTSYDKFCTCGEPMPWSVIEANEAHRAHLASLVFALVEQARAEGAREVAG
jgi:hypothetical protein